MFNAPVLVAAPADSVVTLDEAKRHLRVDGNEEDGRIAALIAAATAHLDAAGGGWLGRALRPQTWELRLDRFPCAEFSLPYPPLIDVLSVKYDGADGIERTLAAGIDYRIVGAGGFGPAALAPAYGKTWPDARADPEAVRILYRCGYQPGPPDQMPEAIKQAVLLLVGLWFENREAAGAGDAPIAFGLAELLAPYRIYVI